MIFQPPLLFVASGEPNNFYGHTTTVTEDPFSGGTEDLGVVDIGPAHADRRVILAVGCRDNVNWNDLDTWLNDGEDGDGEYDYAAKNITVGPSSALALGVFNEATGTSSSSVTGFKYSPATSGTYSFAAFRAVMSSGTPYDNSGGTGSGNVNLDIPGPGFAIIIAQADRFTGVDITNVDGKAINSSSCDIGYYENTSEMEESVSFFCSPGTGGIYRGWSWSLA